MAHGRQVCPHGALVSSCRCADHNTLTTMVPCPWPEVHAEYPTLRQRPGDQPLPVPNERPDVQSQLIEHIRARRNLGIQRYGTALQPFNGRDAGQDLLDELLDGATYAMQLVIERRELEDRNRALQGRVAELEAELRIVKQDRATLVEDSCDCSNRRKPGP